MNKPKRVYVLEYDITYLNKEKEHRIEYYSFADRQLFIDKYLRIQENYLCNTGDINTYYSELQDLDMNAIINAI
jgi:hypothetical protein